MRRDGGGRREPYPLQAEGVYRAALETSQPQSIVTVGRYHHSTAQYCSRLHSRSGSGKTTNMKRVLGHLVTTTQPQEGTGVSHSACIVILSWRRRFGSRGSLMVESPGGGETVCPAAGGPRLPHGELLQHQDWTGHLSNLPPTNFSPPPPPFSQPPHSFSPPPLLSLHHPPVPPTYSHTIRLDWSSSTPFDPWPKNH